jgi:hypothetical protein
VVLVVERAILIPIVSRCYLQNQKEIDAIVPLARYLQDEAIPYRIITPYDAQRSALENALKDEDLDWHDKCFNVDSFQGQCPFVKMHRQSLR